MSEIDARERYYWSKIRQALKGGDLESAAKWLDTASEQVPHLTRAIQMIVAATFELGCRIGGDPAPLDKENDHE